MYHVTKKCSSGPRNVQWLDTFSYNNRSQSFPKISPKLYSCILKSNCSWSQLLIFWFLKSMVTRYMYIKERSENLPEYFPKFKLRYLKKNHIVSSHSYYCSFISRNVWLLGIFAKTKKVWEPSRIFSKVRIQILKNESHCSKSHSYYCFSSSRNVYLQSIFT